MISMPYKNYVIKYWKIIVMEKMKCSCLMNVYDFLLNPELIDL